jgi:putative membrane protein
LADDQADNPHSPDVRFSLANERTLLAYQRTAIGLMAAAIAVIHFFGDSTLVFLLAAALIVTGGVAAVGGYLHYRTIDAAIRQGRAVGQGPTAHVVSVALMLCLLVAAAYVITRGS